MCTAVSASSMRLPSADLVALMVWPSFPGSPAAPGDESDYWIIVVTVGLGGGAAGRGVAETTRYIHPTGINIYVHPHAYRHSHMRKMRQIEHNGGVSNSLGKQVNWVDSLP